jgi:retron-type reverse transcriptase
MTDAKLISIPSLEDKIVQAAAVKLLNAIFQRIFWNVPMGSDRDAMLFTLSKAYIQIYSQHHARREDSH